MPPAITLWKVMADFVDRTSNDFNENSLNSMSLHLGAIDLLLATGAKGSRWYLMPT
jgi:hypothetical protein